MVTENQDLTEQIISHLGNLDNTIQDCYTTLELVDSPEQFSASARALAELINAWNGLVRLQRDFTPEGDCNHA